MSIATEIERLQNAKASLKTSLINKGVTVSDTAKIDEYPSLVDSIETGGGSSSEALWCGGNNPVLIASAKEIINLANDTTYNSITPSTTSQIIKEKSTLVIAENVDLEKYDYVVIQKFISAISYKDAPTDISFIKNYVAETVYNLGDMYVNSLTSKTGYIRTLCSDTGVLYQKASSGDTYSTYCSGGIRVSNSYTPYYYQYGKQLTIYASDITAQVNSTFMQEEAFNYVDAENSNLTFIAEVYRIDKSSPCTKLNNEVVEATARGSFD